MIFFMKNKSIMAEINDNIYNSTSSIRFFLTLNFNGVLQNDLQRHNFYTCTSLFFWKYKKNIASHVTKEKENFKIFLHFIILFLYFIISLFFVFCFFFCWTKFSCKRFTFSMICFTFSIKLCNGFQKFILIEKGFPRHIKKIIVMFNISNYILINLWFFNWTFIGKSKLYAFKKIILYH